MAKKGRRDRADPDPGRGGHARAAGGHRPGPARRQHHGVLQAVQRGQPRASGARSSRPRSRSSRTGRSRSSSRRRPRRCCSGPRPASPRASTNPGQGEGGVDHRRPAHRDRQDKMPDLNANDLEAATPQVAGTARSMGITVELHRESTPHHRKELQEVHRRRPPLRQGSRLHAPGEAVDLVKSLASAKFDETVELAVRLGVDPRKADQIVRGTVGLPAGTGKDGPGGGVRRRRRPPTRPGRPAPTWWAPTTWSPGSRAASSTSTWPSPRPTSWPRWASSAGSSAPAASCPTPRRAPSPPTSAGPSASSRADGSSTAPTATATSTSPSARSASTARPCSPTCGPCVDELGRVKPASAKGRYMRGITRVVHHGPGRQGRPGNPVRAVDDELAAAGS